ncbi:MULTISPECIES: hypothetical protein [Kitasatospora]|uniref:Uncharacterized protein n=1 Tax=Kitasatospora setae (strain ATCC 33774 / DSM 43861 / JCM 3304 / KCC A-0304 / NBRC 14216 / KM-6054) TaxID=452652 RepID=E4NE32_KITSK|nr:MULTISPECIES: hypothetical protein [Kitasatospora]BAJ29463.1 hypothetical protein KSE_36590 [Kitasatospora setae KM-6054]
MTVPAPPFDRPDRLDRLHGLDRLDPRELAQALGLVEEIEQYLAGLPAPVAVPLTSPHGSVRQPWNHGHPLPRRTLLDLLARRPARPAEVTVAGHLRLTSRYLAEAGWTQGALWDARGRVCLLGAQAAVLAHGYGTAYTVRRARAQVMEVLHATGRAVPSPDVWNDRPGRRQSEVHALLERARARAHFLGI